MKRWLKRTLVAVCCAVLSVTAGALVGCSSCTKDESCKHDWKETVVTAATCTTDGVTTRTCSKCEETETVTVKAAHSYGEAVVVKATCTTRGQTTYECTACGDTYTAETTDPTGHTYKASNTVEATCTTQGYIEYTCECGDSYIDVTADKKGHDTLTAEWTFLEETQVEGSCYYVRTEVAECAICGEPVTHEEGIEKHTYSVAITTAATCSQEGEKTYSCNCGHSYTEAFVNAGGHSWVAGEVDTATGITPWTCEHNAAHTKTSFSAKDMIATTVPAEAIQSAGEIELQNATIELPDEVKTQLKDGVDLSVDTLDDGTKATATENLTDEEKAKLENVDIFNFNMAQGTTAVTEFDKEITVTVPYTLEYGADPADIAVWYIDNEGKLTSIKATYSEAGGKGYATFQTKHFSYYTVVRLSAKERCALYGHEEKVTVIPATCEKDGYTLTKCIRCNETSRSAFTKALGHTYSENTVAPSCTSKGYTTYSCTRENCGYAYTAKWVDMIAHTYEATVVEPTCTAKGYTAHTCKACGDSYIDTQVAAKGHSYENGACTVCGRQDPSFVDTDKANFYFNLIESVGTAESWYVEVKNVKINTSEISYSDGQNGDLFVEEMEVELKNIQLEVAMDNEYLVGKGVAVMTMTEIEDGETTVNNGTVQLVLRDGKIYLSAEEDGDSMYYVVSQDALLAQIGLNKALSMVEGLGIEEKLNAIVESIKSKENSPINKAIATVMEYVFTKTETAIGYHFELNYDRIGEVYLALTEKTVDELVDAVLGAGSYDKICSYLTKSVDKKIGALVTEIKLTLALGGVDLEAIYDLANTVLASAMGEEEFDVRTVIAQYSEMKVSELLDMAFDVEAGAMDYKAMIEEYAGMLKEMTLMDIIGNMGNTNAPESGSGHAPGYGEKIEYTAEEEEETDEIYAIIVESVALLKKLSISFDTEKTGELIAFTVNATDFGEMKTPEEVKQEAIENGYNGYIYEGFMVTGKLTVKPNAGFSGSFEGVVLQGEKMLTVANGYMDEFIKNQSATNSFAYKDVEDGEIWLNVRPYKILEEGVEDTYAGQKVTKMTCFGDAFVLDGMPAMVTAEKDCMNWQYYRVGVMRYEYVEFTIWVNEEGTPIGLELVEESLASGEFYISSEIRFYYDTVTGEYEFDSDTMHNYVLVAHKDPEGCEGEGYDKYTCNLCGDSYTNTYTNGHDYTRTYQLAEGAKSCEDGVICVKTCEACGKTNSSFYGTGHFMFDVVQPIGHSDVCGDLALEYTTCACGYEKYNENLIGGCKFDYVTDEYFDNTDTVRDHYIDYYACPAQDREGNLCGFTMTREHKEVLEGCYWYQYVIVTYYKADSTVLYTYTDKWEEYEAHREYVDASTYDEATGLYTHYEYCNACDWESSHYQYKEDQYGNTIYYKSLDHEEEEWERAYDHSNNNFCVYYRNITHDYGWTREYDGCEYVQYDLNGNYDYEGDMHEWYWREYPYSSSCTQYQAGSACDVCYYCREVRVYEEYASPRGHQYEYNEDLGTSVCTVCGLKNSTAADYVEIEDLTYVEEGYAVGYWNKYGNGYNLYVVINYGAEGEQYLEGVTCTDRTTYANSGIIRINMEELESALKAMGLNVEEVSVSLVMQYYDPESGEYNEETGDWEGSYLDCVLTFE